MRDSDIADICGKIMLAMLAGGLMAACTVDVNALGPMSAGVVATFCFMAWILSASRQK